MPRRRNLSGLGTYALLREYKGTLNFEWMRRHGAHAVGIGRKLVNGKLTDTLALRVYVARKRAESELGPDETVSSSIRFLSRKAKREATLQTDVIETPQAHYEVVDPETRIRAGARRSERWYLRHHWHTWRLVLGYDR